jgi:N-acetylneuraminic acid mutarotase
MPTELRQILGAALLAACLASCLASPAAAQAPQGPWLTLAPFPVPSEEVLGAAANGKMYVFAGLAPGWKPKALVYEYDPAANTWTQKKPMPLPSHHLAFTTLNDKIYAFGGFKLPESGPPAWDPIDNAWEYDPATDTWKALAPLPSKRGAASAAVLDGKIYVTGGATNLPGVTENGIHPTRPHNVVATVDVYDVATNTWSSARPLLLARNHHASAAVNGKVYVIGGRVASAFISGTSNNVDLVEAYDPATNLWTARARMPTPRSAIAAGTFGNYIIVPGGEGQNWQFLAAFKAVEAYNTANNTWQILPSMPHQRHGLAVGVAGNRLYAVSGDGQSAGNGIKDSDVDFNEALELDKVLK